MTLGEIGLFFKDFGVNCRFEAMEDTWRFFRPPLAPTLYLCIPKGDSTVYEQEGVSRDAEKLRDYVVQGASKK